MPMPLWAISTKVEFSIDELLTDALADFLPAFRLKPYSGAPILERDKEIVISDEDEKPTSDVADLIQQAAGQYGLDADFVSKQTGNHVRLLHFGRKPPYSICLAIDRENLAFEHQGGNLDNWTVNLISKFTNRLDLDACACAPDYWSQDFHSIDLDVLISKINDATAFSVSAPAIFAIKSRFLDEKPLTEMEKIAANFHFADDGDYKIIWNVP